MFDALLLCLVAVASFGVGAAAECLRVRRLERRLCVPVRGHYPSGAPR